MLDRSKSLQELEGENWGAPGDTTNLAQKCHALRRKPLKDFTVEDLRIMIGQGIGLRFLVPIALERLQEDPLAEGHFYTGDLLQAVLKVERHFWRMYPDLRGQVVTILDRVPSLIERLDEIERRSARQVLQPLIQEFHHE